MTLNSDTFDDTLPAVRPTAAPGPAAAHRREAVHTVPPGWRARSGDGLGGEGIRLRYKGNRQGKAVLVLGGISASRHVTSCDGGWWAELAGPGRALCCDSHLIIGADYPPEGRGEAQRLCPEDFARLFLNALSAQGIERIDALVGASFGGMVGLAMARLAPERIGRLAVLCAAHRPHPMATAVRHVQRQILELTEGTNREADGVALARQLAMTTYRSPEEFGARFARGVDGALEGYLEHQGRRYAGAVSASRYRTLSAAIDAHSEDPRNILVPTTVVAADRDQLVPLELAQELAARLPRLDRFEVLSSIYGHDAFLKEASTIGPILRSLLS